MTTKSIFQILTPRLFVLESKLLGIAFVVFFSFLFTNSFSQVSTGYTFSYGTSANSAMAGGTLLANSSMADANYTIPIGFTFNFNGIDYNTVGVNTNGFIWFGPNAPAVNEYNPLSSATPMDGVVSCYGTDLCGKSAAATLKYLTSGTCPNRTLLIEWKSLKVVGKTSKLDLQIKLTETSNQVELHPYDAGYLVADTHFGQVGLRGTSNADFKNRSVISCSNSWATSTAGASNTATCQIDGITCSTYPAGGARYRFANNLTVTSISWNGSVSTDWYTPANWSSGIVPSTYNNITIPTGLTNYPVLTGSANASCKNFTMAAGATLTTASGYTGTFTINGNLANDGTIINNGSNYMGLTWTAATTISGVGDFTSADLALSGTCTSYSLSNSIIIRKLSIATGSTLSMNGFNLTVLNAFSQIGTINQSTGTLQIEDTAPTLTNATFNENTGTTYFARGISTSAANQTIPSITYYNLRVNTNNGFTSSIGNGTATTCNNLRLINSSTAGGLATAVNPITVNANFDMAPTGNALTFNLSGDVTVSGIMTLYLGLINTATNKVIMNNSAATAVVAGTGNTNYTLSYINGNLRRNIASAVTANYDFPVGDASTSHYAILYDYALSGGGFNYIDSYFGALANHTDASMVATEPSESGITYTHISTEGVWFLDPNFQPTAGTYDVQMYINGFAGLTDDEFAILKRPSTSVTGADWDNGGAGATRPSSMSPGRSLASGFALRLGLSSFSQFGIASQTFTTLPIELLSFQGRTEGKVNVLNWITATEINNDYFNLQRSSDGFSFMNLSTIDGAGNSSQVNTYSYADDAPLNGLNYYRLKQTDYDGTSTYSQIISLVFEDSAFEIVNLSNTDGLSITLNCAANTTIYLELFSIDGKKIVESSKNSNDNQVEILIPTASLSTGIYLFRATDGNRTIFQKIRL